MIYRIYDVDSLTTRFIDEQGATIDDIGDAPFQDIPTTPEAIALVRAERNALLDASDWTQLVDVPLAESQVMQWRIYRQELRDLMNGFAWNISTWPRKP